MSCFSKSRFFFFSTIFLFLFWASLQPVICSDSVLIAQTDSELSELEVDDPWEENDMDGGGMSEDDVWEDNEKSREETDDVWAEGVTQGDEKGQSQIRLSGKVWNKLARDVHEDNEIEDDVFNHAALRVGAAMAPNDKLHAALYVKFDYFSYGNDGDWDNDSTIRIDDAYINFRGNSYNVKIGNQIIRWGKTDALSPLDNLNPEDLRDNLSGRREDRKFPIPMANLELYADNLTISCVFIPFFVRSQYDLHGTDWAVFGHEDGFTLIEKDPSYSLNNSEGGIRLSGIARGLDWAVSWLHTREDLPTPDSLEIPMGLQLPAGDLTISDLADFTADTYQPLVMLHDRQNIFGFEFETTLSSFGVRGDLAYIDNSSFFTRDLQRIRKSVIHTMAGIDYIGENNWYANFQFLFSHIRDYEDRIFWSKENTRAVNGTVWKEFYNGDLKLECRFYYDLSGDATILNPKVRLSFWMPIIVEIGGEWFDGNEETVAGRYKDNDQIYTTIEIKF